MKNLLIGLIVILSSFGSQASTCSELILPFLTSTNSKVSIYSSRELQIFHEAMVELNISTETQDVLLQSLEFHRSKVDTNTLKLYLEYINTFRGEKLKNAVMDIAQLGQREVNSKLVIDFERISKNLPKKYLLYKNQMDFTEFSSLYFSCKSAIPNPKNNNAKKMFSRFSIGLSSLTVGASYAYYNRDQEKDFEWYAKLGYDLSFNAFTSYIGSKIQTNQNDTQLIKSVKNYFNNRIIGIADIALYPLLVPSNDGPIHDRISKLNDNPEFDLEIKKLHKSFDERGLFTKFKYTVIETYRHLIQNKEPISIAGINWDSLTEADLSRPDVQEVLVLAATAELYEVNRGPLLDTGDNGLDRYAFSSLFSATLIPRNMIQSYISYQILCMGQKNPALAITQAAVFTTSINFFVGQAYYSLRKDSINQ